MLAADASPLSQLPTLDPPIAIVCSQALNAATPQAALPAADMDAKVSQPWPLTPALRRCLQITRRQSFVDFVVQLTDDFEPEVESPAASKSIREDEHYNYILRSSHAVAEKFNESEINFGVLLAGTALARRLGLLDQRPMLLQKYNAFASTVDRYLAHRQWSLDNLTPATDKELRPEHMELTTVLNESAEDREPLLRVLDKTLEVGKNFAERERTAHHEAGHAVLRLALLPDTSVVGVTIDPAEDYLGATIFDMALLTWTKEAVLDNACVLLAGRAAEQKLAGHAEGIDSGARSDLESATSHVWRAIVEWGMDDEFGPIVLSACTSDPPFGWLVDEAQKRLQKVLKQAVTETDRLTAKYWSEITLLAKALIERGTISGDDVLRLLPEFVPARELERANIDA